MILDGKKISEKRLELLKEAIDESDIYPRLATVIVGDDPGSRMYVRMKHRACERVGIGSIGVDLPANTPTEQVVESVGRLNGDPEIHGILVQLPLPSQNTEAVIEAVSVEKDVDGFHPENIGRLFSGRPRFVPCTPGGIMTLFEEYGIDCQGKRAVVVGRSIDVGRPMAALLLNANATVTICHSKTKNRFVTPAMVQEGAVVVDVGINHDASGKLCGDVDFEAVREIASAITPVPGGVGPMTIATLMENTFKAARTGACKPVI
jgi:methylenetetrahydrofolate dehydrogenase (NADP+)/methenyltetrahydrofolate cyclohydrolase